VEVGTVAAARVVVVVVVVVAVRPRRAQPTSRLGGAQPTARCNSSSRVQPTRAVVAAAGVAMTQARPPPPMAVVAVVGVSAAEMAMTRVHPPPPPLLQTSSSH
jgi:hypothetical protein